MHSITISRGDRRSQPGLARDATLRTAGSLLWGRRHGMDDRHADQTENAHRNPLHRHVEWIGSDRFVLDLKLMLTREVARLRQSEITGEKGKARGLGNVILSGEAQWDLRFSDIIRIGLLHLWRHVTTVYAIKLGHNIILATRTLHSLIPLLCLYFALFTLCAQISSECAL
jgi:hypothetical protein